MNSKQWVPWALIGGALNVWGAMPKHAQQSPLRDRWASRLYLGLLILGVGFCPALAGDALYGSVVKVKSADVVTLRSATRQYDIRISGIEIPPEVAKEAAMFVSKRVLDKKVGVHLFYRAANGEMVSRLYTKDTDTGKVQDVGLELVRAGLAVPQKGYDYKYGELSAAQSEAQKDRRGYWK